ncbi:class I SAM-dependent methyltransferase [Burkholderia sp. Ac-20392]|uniref:class I SAM-dependent methyltransferase n=1 Tax=Burkholderia sp. Ac-20392 TaxID=2703905 RepID=UPI00198234AC|nr:class I SAM-dependent methyltransferase [Burkholderia sp. Ac-20392]MBN3795558.1 class I SAM-dependent methyltransferase [Burkholderia sp. Ac-20392]
MPPYASGPGCSGIRTGGRRACRATIKRRADEMEHNAAQVFQKIHDEKGWHSQESVSGWGSELKNTAQIIRELPGLLGRFGVRSMLDAPCGDFNWMRHVDLDGIDYIGADIVQTLVTANQATWTTPSRRFVHLDLLRDPLPDADLILCRDCLFHFSHADVFRAFERFSATKARYLLTTTFIYRSYPRNANIATGQWTPINLEMAPFDLDPPLTLLVEGSNESIIYGPDIGTVPMSDRCLGLWSMDSVRERLRRPLPDLQGAQ